jgi:hypothetical protein
MFTVKKIQYSDFFENNQILKNKKKTMEQNKKKSAKILPDLLGRGTA